jgi:hypothetical protein
MYTGFDRLISPSLTNSNSDEHKISTEKLERHKTPSHHCRHHQWLYRTLAASHSEVS